MLKSLNLFIGTGFYSGYFPKAPGTIGSLFAIVFLFIPGFSVISIIVPTIILSIIIGIPLGNYFEKIYGEDPQIFTLDEFAGTWITFLFIPIELPTIIFGFIVWRTLDILKPFPANKAEKLKGGFGIMMDDVVSGVYSLVIMHIFISLFY